MDERQERLNQLEDLKKFIDTSYESVNNILDALEWDRDHILKTDISSSMVTCPISSQHRIPAQKMSRHVTRCKWKNEGYSDSDVPLPEVTEHSKSAIVIDKELQLDILKNISPRLEDNSTLEVRNVPQTSERLISDFSQSERLALYDYAVANTMPPAVLKAEELNISYKKDEGARAKTKLELLMEMRDAKRRRISYRSKKVHTNRKSHVEILREVIQNQMDFLREINGNENEDEEDESTSCSKTDVQVENNKSESGTSKWKNDDGDTKNEKSVCENNADYSNLRRYDSQEWYTKNKYGPRKRDSEIKVHNEFYRRDAGLRCDKYGRSSAHTDTSQDFYDHSGTPSETGREKRTNSYSRRKRERSVSSDWESGDNGSAKKVESTYYETEPSKHHKKHYHRSKFHSSYEDSFSRSEKRHKDGIKRMYENMSTSRSEYGETSKCDYEKQKHHDMKHKEYRLKATSRSFHRSDSESSEFSHGKHSVGEHKTSHTYTSEEEYVHDKEKYISDSYYSYLKHTEEEKERSEKKRKHHKKKKKKKKSKHDSSSD